MSSMNEETLEFEPGKALMISDYSMNTGSPQEGEVLYGWRRDCAKGERSMLG